LVVSVHALYYYVHMLHITATKLREDLFSVLKKVSQGSVMSIDLNGKEVARLVPAKLTNWRQLITEKATLKGDAESVFEPLSDIWKDYE